MVAIDVRGRRGPMITLQLSQALRATPGELLEVLTDRQGVVDYLVSWCRESGARVVSIDTIQGDVRVVLRGRRPPALHRGRAESTAAFDTIRSD